MTEFTLIDTPLVVDERGDACVPDGQGGSCWSHLYDTASIMLWITPERGGVTVAIAGDEQADAGFIGDGLVFSLDADRLENLIEHLIGVRDAMLLASASEHSPVTDQDVPA